MCSFKRDDTIDERIPYSGRQLLLQNRISHSSYSRTMGEKLGFMNQI